MYGHVYRLAEAVAQGAKEVTDVETGIFQVPELVPDDILEQSGAKKARAAFAHIPVARVEQLPDADAVIFGTPTRFGNMVLPDAQFSRSMRWALGARHSDQQDRQCVRQRWHPTWRPRNHDHELSSDPVSSRNDRDGHAPLRAETHEHRRDNRRDSLWRDDARRLGRPEPAS